MSIKSFFAIPFAKLSLRKVYKWINNPIDTQDKVFKNLINVGKKTVFGKDHNFAKISVYEDFKKNVPITDYEGLKPYLNKVIKGESDILWKGKPIYFAKTSGTTSGVKYIPITKESMPTHIKAARDSILFYIIEKKDASFVDGKMIYLQGSPILDNKDLVKMALSFSSISPKLEVVHN